VSFSSFSQTDTPVVILTENQAREVAKDLVRYDALKEIHAKTQVRLNLLLEKESLLQDRISKKDSIISTQQEYIDVQDKIINAKKPITFNGFVGVQTNQLSLTEPTLYIQTEVEISKFTVGARVFAQPNNPGGYGFIVEYKIF
jgi:hypothetical protein